MKLDLGDEAWERWACKAKGIRVCHLCPGFGALRNSVHGQMTLEAFGVSGVSGSSFVGDVSAALWDRNRGQS